MTLIKRLKWTLKFENLQNFVREKRIYFLWTSPSLGGIRIFPQQYLIVWWPRIYSGVNEDLLGCTCCPHLAGGWLFLTKIKSVNFVPSVFSIHFCHCKRRGIISHWWVILDTKILIKLTSWLVPVLSPSSYSPTLLQLSRFVIVIPSNIFCPVLVLWSRPSLYLIAVWFGVESVQDLHWTLLTRLYLVILAVCSD